MESLRPFLRNDVIKKVLYDYKNFVYLSSLVLFKIVVMTNVF